jgi:hypothetical protein
MGNKLRFTYPCIVLCAYRNWFLLSLCSPFTCIYNIVLYYDVLPDIFKLLNVVNLHDKAEISRELVLNTNQEIYFYLWLQDLFEASTKTFLVSLKNQFFKQ